MATPKKRRGTAREPDRILVVGAREHNLRIDRLEIPKRKLVVFTGVSGSGKSSLAFDTLYAEGQRRYIESLSAYARQFLGRLERPRVERIRGLSPTIAIEQKSASTNPRSTVGTITEVYDYLRVLYARAGSQHCHLCGKPVEGRSAEEVVTAVHELPEGSRIVLLAPVVTHRKGEHRDLLEEIRGRGYVRARIDGEMHRLEAAPALEKRRKHTIEIVVDRLSISEENATRLAESVELALHEGSGDLVVELADGDGEPLRFSETRACCGHAFPELAPQSFSFNSPLGMCPDCNGLGMRLEIDPDLIVQDPSLSIREGAITPWASTMARESSWTSRIVKAMARATGVDLDRPWRKLTAAKRRQVLHGLGDRRIRVTWGKEGTDRHGTWGMKFEGIIPALVRRYKQTTSPMMREYYRQFMADLPCDSCGGRRLRPESLAVRMSDRGIADVAEMTVSEALAFFEGLDLEGARRAIAEGVLREVRGRLGFLRDVGLGYLTLDRAGPSLSGGEAQRIRLASQLGSELSGVLYVLDEPSIGLHARDNDRLLRTLIGLRDGGNSVIVVEHDEHTIRSADHVVDFGPGAGHLGGHVVFSGTPKQLEKRRDSLTGRYLAGREHIATPATRRRRKGAVTIRGAAENNLREIDVSVPLGVLVAVTGVSGAGKSSLVNGILHPALSRELHGSSVRVGPHERIEGLESLDKVIVIDQKPIGRTPRSNPGTYTKVFDEIRGVFSSLPDSRVRGYKPGRFSFNVKGGRCEACKGDGVVKVEMHFLADVYVTCEVCAGRRYNRQTLQVKYRGLSIADVLDLPVDDALPLFAAYPKLSRVLRTLQEVGLGYLHLGQPATTLSGGEAQRVKLSRELGKRQTGRTLYVLDEPTTGLHFDDIVKLLDVLQRLVDAGNSVIVIEHNLDVIRCADWIVDLGPEGGDAGGRIVAQGTPEKVAATARSYTGQHLAPLLSAGTFTNLTPRPQASVRARVK